MRDGQRFGKKYEKEPCCENIFLHSLAHLYSRKCCIGFSRLNWNLLSGNVGVIGDREDGSRVESDNITWLDCSCLSSSLRFPTSFDSEDCLIDPSSKSPKRAFAVTRGFFLSQNFLNSSQINRRINHHDAEDGGKGGPACGMRVMTFW